MILRTVIVFVVLFVSLNLMLSEKQGIKIREHAGVYIRNNIRHEGFLYNDTIFDTVMVGSSMSALVDLDVIAKNSYNLTSEGGTFISGLKLIKKKKKLPKCVLIETNSLVRNENELITKPFAIDLINQIRADIPLFQSKNRLGCQFVHESLPVFGKLSSILPADKVIAIDKHGMVRQKTISKIEERELKYNIEQLESFLDFAEHNNIEVIFIELPYLKEVEDPFFPKAQAKVQSYAKKSFVRNITSIGFEDFLLTDRVHLSLESAKNYTYWLKNKVKQN